MKNFGKSPSTSGSLNGDSKQQSVKQTEDFILARIKYLRGLDYYDIITRKDFNRLADQLSFNSRGVMCEEDLKDKIFVECPKETTKRVTVDNVAKIAAKTIHDPLTPKEKIQKLKLIFISSAPKPFGLKKTSLLHYLFGGFGIYALASFILKKVVSKMSSLLQTGISCIIRTYFSSGNHIHVWAFSSVYRDPIVNISLVGSLLGHYLGMGLFKGTNEVTIEGDVQNGQGISLVGKCIEGMGAVMGKGVMFIRDLVIGMFFEKDDVAKTTQFSPENTLFSILCILPAAYVIYAALKDQDSKKGRKDQIKRLKDRFSL